MPETQKCNVIHWKYGKCELDYGHKLKHNKDNNEWDSTPRGGNPYLKQSTKSSPPAA